MRADGPRRRQNASIGPGHPATGRDEIEGSAAAYRTMRTGGLAARARTASRYPERGHDAQDQDTHCHEVRCRHRDSPLRPCAAVGYTESRE